MNITFVRLIVNQFGAGSLEVNNLSEKRLSHLVTMKRGNYMLAKLYRKASPKQCALVGIWLTLLLTTTVSTAQNAVLTEIEIDRDANELSDLLSGAALPKPEVAAILDTALVFTSAHGSETTAHCHANDNSGITVGRVRVRIPAMGVRFFLSSDIVEERGFVGSVICSAAGYVIGTEVMLGVVTSDIEVHQDYRAGVSNLLFPVTAMK